MFLGVFGDGGKKHLYNICKKKYNKEVILINKKVS